MKSMRFAALSNPNCLTIRHPYLKVGRKVRVRSGPFRGCEGVLTRKKGLTRLVISVHLLQQSVSAEVDSDAIEPL